jgi:GntR family transcriptional regulator
VPRAGRCAKRRQLPAQPFETFLSFSSWVRQTGRTPGQRTLEIARRPATADVADALGVDEGDPVVQVLRQRFIDDRPTMVERTTLVEPVGRLLFDFDCDSGSIYAYLSDRGVDLTSARHVIDAVAADPTDARLLDVAVGAPLLRERRLAGSSAGELYEYSDDRYRPDLVNFTIENAEHLTSAMVRTSVS